MAEKNVESLENLEEGSIEIKDNQPRDLVKEGRDIARMKAGERFSIWHIAEDLGLKFKSFDEGAE